MLKSIVCIQSKNKNKKKSKKYVNIYTSNGYDHLKTFSITPNFKSPSFSF